MIWLLLIGLFLLIYQPLAMWQMRGEFPLLSVYTVCLTFIWVFSWFLNPNQRLLDNILIKAIFVYSLAITLSTLFSSYTDVLQSYHFQAWAGYVLFFVILMTTAKTDRDLKIAIIGLLVIYFLLMAHSYWYVCIGRFRFSQGFERLTTASGTDPNYFATRIVCTLPLLFPMIALCKKYWHYLFILGYALLTVRIITFAGSRGALISLVALMILFTLFSRYRFSGLPVVLLTLPLGWFFMPAQYQDRFRTIWDPTISRDADASMQGRFSGFYDGLKIWTNNPLFGAGPGAAPRAGDIALGAHNLPGHIAGELGTLGIITFSFLLLCFGINHYNIWRNYKYLQEKKLGKEGLYCWRVSIAVMYGVAMLLLQGLSLQNAFEFLWIWLAAFHALAAVFLQERVTAAMQGKLLPSLPGIPARK